MSYGDYPGFRRDWLPQLTYLLFGSGRCACPWRRQDPAKLRRVIVNVVNVEEWSSMSADVKGDAYEGLLPKNAQNTKSGAGQYFTPRALIQGRIDCIRGSVLRGRVFSVFLLICDA